MNFYRELEKERNFHLVVGLMGIISVAFSLLALYFRQGFWCFLCAFAGFYTIYISQEGLRKSHRRFCENRIIKISEAMYREKLVPYVGTPKFRKFLWAENLLLFEIQEIECLKNYRRKVLELETEESTLKEFQRWLELEREFCEAAGDVDPQQFRWLKRRWRSLTKFSTKRQMISELRNQVSAPNEQLREVRQRQLQKLRELFDRLSNLCPEGKITDEADDVCRKAVNALGLREKITLLKRAIDLQKQASASKLPQPIEQRTEEPPQVPPQEATCRDLSSAVEKRFNISPYIPDGVDQVMAKQIIIALLEPGKDIHLFASNYRPEDALKRRVVELYRRVKQPFSPKSFAQTLRWLEGEGIVLSKTKTDERVFSLSSKPKKARSEKGADLVRAIGEFARKW